MQINTKNPAAVENEIKLILSNICGTNETKFVHEAIEWIVECFDGRFDGFQSIDVKYHDLEHTFQGLICMTKIFQGLRQANFVPEINKETLKLAILAILFHDSGYLKSKSDIIGTGAKYTLIHVHRSAEFAELYLSKKGFSKNQIESIQRMIHCTGIRVDLNQIQFKNEQERIAGLALGSADLLGQMADSCYVEKLPELFYEFQEALKYDPKAKDVIQNFESPEELIAQTPNFWKNIVLPRLEKDFIGLYKYLNDPWPDGPNPYIKAIEKNMKKIKQLYST